MKKELYNILYPVMEEAYFVTIKLEGNIDDKKIQYMINNFSVLGLSNVRVDTDMVSSKKATIEFVNRGE